MNDLHAPLVDVTDIRPSPEQRRQIEQEEQRQHKSRKTPPDIKAIRAFVRAAEKMSENERRAAIKYFVSRYADASYGIYQRP